MEDKIMYPTVNICKNCNGENFNESEYFSKLGLCKSCFENEFIIMKNEIAQLKGNNIISCDQKHAIEHKDKIKAWVDEETELMWEVKQPSNIDEKFIWDKALKYVKKLINIDEKFTWDKAFKYVTKLNQQNYAGFNDWRVPTIDELETLVTQEEYNKYYIKKPLSKNVVCGSYWSSTTSASSISSARVVYFDSETVGWHDKSYRNYVRCVRDND